MSLYIEAHASSAAVVVAALTHLTSSTQTASLLHAVTSDEQLAVMQLSQALCVVVPVPVDVDPIAHTAQDVLEQLNKSVVAASPEATHWSPAACVVAVL